jgi:hypothetical protein
MKNLPKVDQINEWAHDKIGERISSSLKPHHQLTKSSADFFLTGENAFIFTVTMKLESRYAISSN